MDKQQIKHTTEYTTDVVKDTLAEVQQRTSAKLSGDQGGKNGVLMNARLLYNQSPKTFLVPSIEDLKKVTTGNWVKVCHNQERFWCTVKKPLSHGYEAVVTDHFCMEQPWEKGDTISIGYEHVYATETTSEEEWRMRTSSIHRLPNKRECSPKNHDEYRRADIVQQLKNIRLFIQMETIGERVDTKKADGGMQ